MNCNNTYKQIEGRNQPMQLDLLKFLSRSTSTPTPKFVAGAKKVLYWIVDVLYNDRAFGIHNLET